MNRAQERAAWTAFFTGEKPKKPAKYRNEKVVANGRKFDSKREAERAGELELQQKLGLISDLKYQVRFELIGKQKGERPAFLKVDFTYVENRELVAEDVKSKASKTQQYVLRRKLLLERHGIRIREVE
jgi:Protein of unknown function (DUF1064)